MDYFLYKCQLLSPNFKLKLRIEICEIFFVWNMPTVYRVEITTYCLKWNGLIIGLQSCNFSSELSGFCLLFGVFPTSSNSYVRVRYSSAAININYTLLTPSKLANNDHELFGKSSLLLPVHMCSFQEFLFT